MAARTSHGLIVIVMTGSLLCTCYDKEVGWRRDGELESRCSGLRAGSGDGEGLKTTSEFARTSVEVLTTHSRYKGALQCAADGKGRREDDGIAGAFA